MWLTKLRQIAAVVLALGMLGAGPALSIQPAADPAPPLPAAQAATPQKEGAAKQAAVRSQEILHDALKQFNASEETGGLRHRVLADMACLQARLGDRAAALKLFEQARDIVANIEQDQQPGEWRVLATAEARAGEMDQAIATTNRIPEGNQFRDITFQEVAVELARNRREKDAVRVSDMIVDGQTKSWVGLMLLERLALAHAAAGDFPEAMRVVERIKQPDSQVNVLAGVFYFNLSYGEYPQWPDVALLQAKAGDKALAKKTLQRAAELATAMTDADAPGRPRALTALACAQAQLGEFAAARKTAEGITHKTGKTIALAQALGKAGRAKEVLPDIDALPVGVTEVHALAHLGTGQAKAGDQNAALASFERAHGLIGQLEENDRGGESHNLAAARAVAGDYKGAMRTAEAFLPDGSVGYVNIAYARAEAGDFAGALEMAGNLKGDVWWRGNLLRSIAWLQAQRGQTKAALEWIGRLDAPLERANGLLGVAEGLAR